MEGTRHGQSVVHRKGAQVAKGDSPAWISALPPLELTMSNLEASRSGDTVTTTGSVRANEDYPGEVLWLRGVLQHFTIVGFGELSDGVNQPLELPLPLVPPEATSVRFWMVGPGAGPSNPIFGL